MKTLRSFPPVVDRRSRILILGTMPGPTALRRRQYYGFEGNHFWPILAELLGVPKPEDYRGKVQMLRRGRIAVWDTLAACVRPTALDSHIRKPVPNNVPRLLERFPKIEAVFVNGGAAEAYFRRFHAREARLPATRLPSTSPANATIPYVRKLACWQDALGPYLFRS